jgi:hypothetical protein
MVVYSVNHLFICGILTVLKNHHRHEMAGEAPPSMPPFCDWWFLTQSGKTVFEIRIFINKKTFL